MTRVSVACCGSVVCDLIFEVDSIPKIAEKMAAKGFREAGGGLAATAAVAISALGGMAEFWGCVGQDVYGRRLTYLLEQRDVFPRLHLLPGGQTPVSGMFMDRRGERMLAFFRGDALENDGHWLPLGDLGAFDAVVCDVRWPRGATAVLAAAGALGIPRILDADTAPAEDIANLISLSDYALLSGPALKILSGIDDPSLALRAINRPDRGIVGVTLGGRGFLWLEGDHCWLQPAFRVQAVETNGAGDVFHGAYAFAIARGADLASAARFASATAALKCGRSGGWQSVPTIQDVEALLAVQRSVVPTML